MGDSGIAALYDGGSSVEMPMMPRPCRLDVSRRARARSRNRVKYRKAILIYWQSATRTQHTYFSVLAVLEVDDDALGPSKQGRRPKRVKVLRHFGAVKYK